MNRPDAIAAHLPPDYASLDDRTLAGLIVAGDRDAFAFLMSSCNQRLFRLARGLVDSDDEAEDVVQAGYLAAYEHLPRFRGEAALATWLTRIVLNEARQRWRRRRVVAAESPSTPRAAVDDTTDEPDVGAARAELRRLLERAIASLPPAFRVVYVMRELEELSVDETAEALSLRRETVKTRLHRARRLMRSSLEQAVATPLREAFTFLGARCAGLTRRVLDRVPPPAR